jgi:uncharacterized protein YciI
MRFAYVYFMKHEPERIRLAVPNHVRLGCGCSSRATQAGRSQISGGLIVFEAPSPDEAQRAVESDPVVVEDLLETYWLKEWSPE